MVMSKNIFEGLTVLDFSAVIGGPLVGSFFADFGAEVIKIEIPGIGDQSRGWSPQIEGSSLSYWWFNRGKKGVTLDLTDQRGAAIAQKMAESADVILENNRPGIMKRFGLDYEAVKKVNPSIIYLSLTSFGQTGARANKPGYDVLAQAVSGLMDYNGFADGPPQMFSFVIGDYVSSFHSIIGTLSALYHRAKTGLGQHVDVAVVDSLVSMNNNIEINSATGRMLRRSGNHQAQNAPYGVFMGNNGESVVIATASNATFNKFLNAMGDAAGELRKPPFDTAHGRVENLTRLVELIEAWLKTFPSIDAAIELMDKCDVPVAKIKNGSDLANDQDLVERGMIIDFPTPSYVKGLDKIKARGVVTHMSETPGSIKQAPSLGEHNVEVLTRYGFDEEYIRKLQTEWLEKKGKK
jgi:crotonobetainyl-CoA:carnitine CoA-transferase CaiB-like acyl-CoA transferase